MESKTEQAVITSAEEKISKLTEFTDQGIEIIKNGQYRDAIRHFDNKKFATSLGFMFGDAKVKVIHKDIEESEDIQNIVDFVSYHSHFNQNGGKLLEIKLADIVTLKFTDEGGEYHIPEKIWQNIALVHLEEWLHSIQFLSQKPLAGEEEEEIDVALFMRQKGIKLTDEFLSRHGRSTALSTD